MKTLKELRGELIGLGFDRLEVGQQMQRVPQGPGYLDAMQLLRARQDEVSQRITATQQQIKALLAQSQPTLF